MRELKREKKGGKERKRAGLLGVCVYVCALVCACLFVYMFECVCNYSTEYTRHTKYNTPKKTQFTEQYLNRFL